MSTVLLTIQNGSLPPGYCPSSDQQRLNDFAALMQAVLPGQAFYNYGDTKPTPENQIYPWFRTTDGRWYYFSGKWKAPIGDYSAFERRWFAGNLTDLLTYDGGDTNPPSAGSGPTWQEDTAFIGRSPLHPGLIPETTTVSPFNKTLNVGEAYGDGSHVQVASEMPVHAHTPDTTQADSFWGHAAAGSPATGNVLGGGDSIRLPQTGYAGGNGLTPSVTQPMSLVQPVLGLYCIKRTGRTFYVVP